MSPKCSYIKNLRKRGRATSVFLRDVHPIFVVTQRSIFDKDIDERCKIFLDSMEARIASLESEQFSTKNSFKILEHILEQNNSAVIHWIPQNYAETLPVHKISMPGN